MKKIVVILGIGLTSIGQIFADGKIPANMVLLDKTSNSYIDIREVTVGDWNVFLNYYKDRSEEYYQYILPDDAICRQAYKAEDYLTNPNFQNYPIVGITYEQMKSYCSWRTDMENMNKKQSNTTVYSYSLPTENELQNAYDLQAVKTSVRVLSPVDTKAKGITGIADNAREVTENKKNVVGEGSNGLRFDNYTSAASNLGFRCKLTIK